MNQHKSPEGFPLAPDLTAFHDYMQLTSENQEKVNLFVAMLIEEQCTLAS